MKVIKRDGRIQEFMIDKIRTSLARTSDEINNPLTDSDLNVIVEAIMKNLKALKKDEVKSMEIREIVFERLNYFGFTNIANEYNLKK